MDKLIFFLERGMRPEERAAAGVYERSVAQTGGTAVMMVDLGERDALVVTGEKAGFHGEALPVPGRDDCLLAPLTHENAVALRAAFPFTAPVRVLGNERSVGVGDRLGVATDGHIRVFERFDASPIFAQQSIRELTLTGRTFDDVLDQATFAVFRQGYRGGFGADGDHLKTPAEVAYALGCGYTMITLDCSEHIRNNVAAMPYERLAAEFPLDKALAERYLGPVFDIGDGVTLRFDAEDLCRMAAVYGDAIAFAAGIWQEHMAGSNADFELSIDETLTPTSPLQHFFVAGELARRGVKPATVAPRFIGEFQKGIDYMGDLAAFEAELAVHAQIARHFGYKLSVHSGSDKFSVFALVGKHTRQRYHVKTAGTNWLEAMRLVSQKAPALYREIHAFALESFAEATKYYHVSADPAGIPPLAATDDAGLPAYFARDDARQLIHITYGLILAAKNPDGSPRFKNRLYKLWRSEREAYAVLLDTHIGRHLDELGCPRR